MIYLLEDDPGIRELVGYTLKSAGFDAEAFALPSEFWDRMKTQYPDLILLDIMLPEEDGIQILKKLRSETPTRKIPVMMMTARGTEYDKVIGLENGADDYLPKPFGMMEMIARVKALLRRSTPEDAPDYSFEGLKVYPAQHLVLSGGQAVPLTLKEYDLLCFLIKNKNIVLTREQILDHVWGMASYSENRTVDVHIRSLRNKLGASGVYIETVRGVGYKFNTVIKK